MSAARLIVINDKWLMIMPFDKKAYSRKSFQKRNVTPYKAKRGNLKPLMTEDQKSSANIQDLQGSLCWACRSNFACRIIRLFQYLTEDADYKEYILSKQIYRSGTSIGANTREAQLSFSEYRAKLDWAMLSDWRVNNS